MSDKKLASDRNFDELSDRFAHNIYSTPKGEIRLRLIQDELLTMCPQLQTGESLRILDAGCGMGQMTALLSKLGHHVLCCDISSALLAGAREMLEREQSANLANVEFVHASIQDLHKHTDGTFDLIIFHAVLEWMEQPKDGLQSLLKWLKPSGTLSIMFYNVHSLIFKNLLRGNFRKIEERDFRGDPGSLTPINPLDPADVEQWLAESGLTVLSKRGIRTFYDYMDMNMKNSKEKSKPDKREISVEDIIRLEKQYGIIEPYRSLGRYMLLHAVKTAT